MSRTQRPGRPSALSAMHVRSRCARPRGPSAPGLRCGGQPCDQAIGRNGILHARLQDQRRNAFAPCRGIRHGGYHRAVTRCRCANRRERREWGDAAQLGELVRPTRCRPAEAVLQGILDPPRQEADASLSIGQASWRNAERSNKRKLMPGQLRSFAASHGVERAPSKGGCRS